MSTRVPKFTQQSGGGDVRIGIVAARFNEEIVDELLAGCVRRLRELKVREDRVEIERVPGAFELPVAAKAMCRGGG